jgi:hypothetical protein
VFLHPGIAATDRDRSCFNSKLLRTDRRPALKRGIVLEFYGSAEALSPHESTPAARQLGTRECGAPSLVSEAVTYIQTDRPATSYRWRFHTVNSAIRNAAFAALFTFECPSRCVGMVRKCFVSAKVARAAKCFSCEVRFSVSPLRSVAVTGPARGSVGVGAGRSLKLRSGKLTGTPFFAYSIGLARQSLITTQTPRGLKCTSVVIERHLDALPTC